MKSSRWFPLALIVLAATLASCFTPLSRSGTEPSGLSITIGDNITPRTLPPPLDMIPVSYTITGTGPGTVLSSGVITAGAGAVVTGRLFTQSTVGLGAGIQVAPSRP